MRNHQLPGRSAVLGTNAMAATSHPLATAGAIKVLREGGNAVDAAIAASAVLCVVEPHMTGIGGDCFVILHEPDGSIHSLNGSGRSPRGARLDWYLEHKVFDFFKHPAHSVTVPGAIKAWETLRDRFGTRDFGYLFADAIGYARNGYPVSEIVAQGWAGQTSNLAKDAGASRHFLFNGKAPGKGDVVKIPALADTFETIAKKGADGFYSGAIAKEITRTVSSQGGFLSMQDLADVSADWVTPITANYGGHDIHEIPPNSQGITALILLRLLERLELRKLDFADPLRIHLLNEAGRIAYAVRDQYIGDPEAMDAHVEALLSDAHIKALSQQYQSNSRNKNITLPSLPNSDTVYLTIIDRDLRAVSFINSIYGEFGSRIVTPDSGICLQNRGISFCFDKNHPNVIGPAKRPMHTIIPGMATKNGQLSWSFGVMGGAYQPMGHAQVMSNMIDYGLDPQEALDDRRFFFDPPKTLALEDGFSGKTIDKLVKLGHRVKPIGRALGGGQIIGVDHKRGVLIAGSDPRKDGMASGF